MSLAVLVVDPGVPAGAPRQWSGTTRALALTNPRNAADAVRWVRGRGASEVLVLCRPGSVRSARTIATTLAGSIVGVAATVRERECTVLGLAVAAAHALELETDPALAEQAIWDALGASVTGAHLRRVTRLERPRPSIWQHVTSIFGRRHVAVVAPGGGRVHRADRPISLPEGATLLVGADASSPLFEVVQQTWPTVPCEAVPETVATQATFGSAGAEFIAFVPPAVRRGTHECPVCRHAAATPVCPFCRIRTTPQERAA